MPDDILYYNKDNKEKRFLTGFYVLTTGSSTRVRATVRGVAVD